jgi:hypothetical protein
MINVIKWIRYTGCYNHPQIASGWPGPTLTWTDSQGQVVPSSVQKEQTEQ